MRLFLFVMTIICYSSKTALDHRLIVEVLKCAGLVDYYAEHGPAFLKDTRLVAEISNQNAQKGRTQTRPLVLTRSPLNCNRSSYRFDCRGSRVSNKCPESLSENGVRLSCC